MANLRGFDANTVEPTGDFEPIPAGVYEAIAIDSEMKATKSGTGSYLQVAFEIVAGPHRGRRLWARFNLQNSNQLAVQIARAELAAFCLATGVHAPNDSVELHGIPVLLKVGVKKRSDTQELQNEIRSYSPRSTSVVPSETAVKQEAGSKQTTPPWKR